jgi:hypothetical protein
MKTNKPEGEFGVGLIGMRGFFLAWLSLLNQLEATTVVFESSADLTNGFATAVRLPIAAALLFAGDTVRFRQMGHWVSKASRTRE